MAGIFDYAERFRALMGGDEQKSVTGGFMVPPRSEYTSPIWRLFGFREGRMPLKKAVKDGYNASEWVAVCVDEITKAVATVPWRVSKEVTNDGLTDEQRALVMDARWELKTADLVEKSKLMRDHMIKAHILEPVLHHDLEDLLAQPNPFMDYAEFFSRVTQHLLLTGNAIITKVRSNIVGGGKVKELWVINPDHVEIIPDPKKYIFKYRVYGSAANGGKSQDYKDVDPKDVIHLQLPNPDNAFWGRSVLEAAAMVVDTDREAMRWQKQSLENRAAPDSVVSLEEGINPNHFDTYLDQFRKQYAGRNNARTPILLGHGARYFQTSFSPVEMDFINSRNAHRDAILSVFGVNKVVAGVLEANNAGIKEYRRDFWVATIIPFLTRLQAAMNRALTPEFESQQETLYIWPDLSNVDALRENFHAKARSAALFARHGVSMKALNRRLDLGFRPDELEYLEYALMPASTRYLPEIIAGLNEPNGDPNQAQPDNQEDPVEPDDGADNTDPEGLRSWTPEEAKYELDVYNVSWGREIEVQGVLGFHVEKASEGDAEQLALSEDGVRLLREGRDLWVAFRKNDGGAAVPLQVKGE